MQKLWGIMQKLWRLMSKGGEEEYYTYSQDILAKERASVYACTYDFFSLFTASHMLSYIKKQCLDLKIKALGEIEICLLKPKLLIHNIPQLFTLQIPFQVIQEELGDTAHAVL